jgi:hypothetical protein
MAARKRTWWVRLYWEDKRKKTMNHLHGNQLPNRRVLDQRGMWDFRLPYRRFLILEQHFSRQRVGSLLRQGVRLAQTTRGHERMPAAFNETTSGCPSTVNVASFGSLIPQVVHSLKPHSTHKQRQNRTSTGSDNDGQRNEY